MLIEKKWKSLIVILVLLLVFFLILLIFKNYNVKDSISIESFGAKGDDNIDDTLAIQKAINFAYENNFKEVTFPKGLYLINATKSIRLKSNVTLKFEDGTALQALPNDSENYAIISIRDIENVSLLGKVIIVGDRKKHKGTTGEWGFGISIRGSENIHIENSIIKDNWGDGIYIGSTERKDYSKDITIANIVSKNNRRQGISIISAINLKITNSKFIETNGTSPAFGIDFEPNKRNEFLKNIKIENPFLEGNEGGGIQFYLKKVQNSNNPIDIEIIIKSGIKEQIVMKETNNVKGEIKITNLSE